MKVSDSDIVHAYTHFCRADALKYLGISQSAYYKRLNKLGIKLNKSSRVSDEAIIEAFNPSKSIREAAKKVGVHHSSYHKRMKKLDLDFCSKHDLRKYSIDDNVFKNMSPEVAYWIGFIAADGTIVNNTLSFMLSKRDEEMLLKFLKFCKSDYKIHYNTSYYIGKDEVKHEFDAVNLKITSDIIVQDLSKYGVVPNKKNLEIPFIEFIPDKYKLDFIVGYFDGDGSVTNNTKRQVITIATNYANSSQIIDVLQYYNIHCNEQYRGNICVIYISNKANFNKFKEIYKNRDYSVMQRKLNKFNIK